MTERTKSIQREVALAREDVHRDLDDLGRELRRDEAKIRQNTAIVAASAAGVGLLLGFAGPKNTLRVFLAAALVGGTIMALKNRA